MNSVGSVSKADIVKVKIWQGFTVRNASYEQTMI